MNNKKIIPILIVLTVVFTVIGATFAYWSWTSDNANKTNITFTIGADFSCGANGGGNIASSNVAPASCTNSTYAIQREITTTITNSGSDPVSMDMWLTVNSIDSGLSSTSNFKWALTTDSTSCSSNIVNEGTFQGKTTNSTVTILSGSTASTATYYLYIWLDNAETATTSQNQSYSFSLGGSCTNEVLSEQTVYTVNLYDENVEGFNIVHVGQPIPNSITTYQTPEAAMAALKAASGGSIDRTFYLMHKIGNYSGYCLYEKENGIETGIRYCFSSDVSQSECNAKIPYWEYDDYTYECRKVNEISVVTESYLGFVITPELVSDNPGMVAGTYTLKGGDGGASFLANAKTLYDAFGGVGCDGDSNLPATYDATYNPNPSNLFYCEVQYRLQVSTDLPGNALVQDMYSGNSVGCGAGTDGTSNCERV